MFLKVFYRSIIFLTVLTAFWFLTAVVVFAETINLEISGNGSGSTNETSLTSNQTTNVSQSNTADVNNEVDANLNTGQNSTSGNTSDQTNISTGDSSTNIGVSNDLNSSSAGVNNCCPQSLDVVNSGNGADSNNTINSNINTSTNISVTNIANITNNINADSNTGKNYANNNNGSVNIITGDINISGGIHNSANSAIINASNGFGGSISILNKLNGANSTNLLGVNISNDFNFENFNLTTILNDVIFDLNTGENYANNNLGDTSISTGNINVDFTINNDANSNIVQISCCPQGGVDDPGESPKPGDQPSSQPSTTPSQASPSSSSSSGPGSNPISNAILGLSTLPATGSYFLFFAILSFLATLLMGVVLRLLASRSPPLYATV